MVVSNQTQLDAAFDDMDVLLSSQRPIRPDGTDVCVNCGAGRFVYNGQHSAHPGSRVCDLCGVVEQGVVIWETMYGNILPTKTSNYKRIHHWHERISQLLLAESPIPNHEMLQIGRCICNGDFTIINKDVIRTVLRSLNMQLYIEKWLQIIFRITKIAPPIPGPLIVRQLDELFLQLQQPFEGHRAEGRKNFLNYNYVFCRLLQKLDCAQFCMFFPLIKSKSKLQQLDDTWCKMVKSLGWPVTPLLQVAPFAVQLEQPALLLQDLDARCASQNQVVIERAPWKTVAHLSGRSAPERTLPPPKRHRSNPPAQSFRKLEKLGRRPV